MNALVEVPRSELATAGLYETASSAVAAQAKAMVESRYVMALKKPRNWDQVRQDVIRECRRPGFAHNKSAYYRKPIGNGVEGLGIRFVEVALRCMTNVLIETTMIFEDNLKEIHRVTVTDLEANTTYPLDVRVSKTVERSKPMDDGSYISMRTNSSKRLVYTVPANDDDLLNKRAALISKAIRTLGLRIIPGDIQDEGEAEIKRVRINRAAQDPAAERKGIVDDFGEIGVKASDLADYLGHSLDQCSPAQLVDLRGIYGAIRDGEATWKSAMENKAERPPGDGTQPAAQKAAQSLPFYDAEKFKQNLPAWQQAIKDGKATAEKIVGKLKSTNSITPEQETAILNLQPAEPPAQDAQPTANKPTQQGDTQ